MAKRPRKPETWVEASPFWPIFDYFPCENCGFEYVRERMYRVQRRWRSPYTNHAKSYLTRKVYCGRCCSSAEAAIDQFEAEEQSEEEKRAKFREAHGIPERLEPKLTRII